MTKSELIKTVAKQASLTEAQTNEAVKALTDVITAALAKGEKVQLPGLFTAETVERPARNGRMSWSHGTSFGISIRTGPNRVPIGTRDSCSSSKKRARRAAATLSATRFVGSWRTRATATGASTTPVALRRGQYCPSNSASSTRRS